MITYLPYYHLDAAFDNGLRKDYGNSEIRYDHFYYKEKKLSFTRQEFCNAHQLGAGKSFRICLAVEEIAGNIVEHGFTGKKENILLIFG